MEAESKIVPKAKVKLKEVKVIAFSLWGKSINRTYGAIRNVNLARLYFPDWTVRIYTENSINGTTVHEPVPKRILQKLQYLGAEVRFLSSDFAEAVHPVSWHYIVADDIDVDRFIVRDPESRLCERDSRIVRLWEKSEAGFHCIRDHVNHARHAIVDGLWGGRPEKVRKLLTPGMRQDLVDYFETVKRDGLHSEQNATEGFLETVLWGKIRGTILCHDSVSCHEWGSTSVGLPWRREGYEYVGGRYDVWGRLIRESVRDDEPQANSAACEGIT